MRFEDVPLNARVRLAPSAELPRGGEGTVLVRYVRSRRLDVRLDDGALVAVEPRMIEQLLALEQTPAQSRVLEAG